PSFVPPTYDPSHLEFPSANQQAIRSKDITKIILGSRPEVSRHGSTIARSFQACHGGRCGCRSGHVLRLQWMTNQPILSTFAACLQTRATTYSQPIAPKPQWTFFRTNQETLSYWSQTWL